MCLREGYELDEEYYLSVLTLPELKYPRKYIKILKKKKEGDKVRLDGRKGPTGKVIVARKDYCIAEFDKSKVEEYLK